MKNSKKEVENAVITVSETLGIEKPVEILLFNVGLHSTIKEVIFNAFLQNKNDYFEKDDKTFESYQLIRKYCNEMFENGEVNFDVK